MKYAQISLGSPRSTHNLILQLAGHGGEVLDIGSSTGLLALELSKRDYHVTCIEIDQDRAELSRQNCQKMIIGNVMDEPILKSAGGPFDLIVCSDVLEHLTDPELVLTRIRKLLKPDGYVLISIPNIANYRIRFRLLCGKFSYEEEGILDISHLRFFTLKSALDLVKSAGYSVGELRFAAFRMPKSLLHLAPKLLATQFVFKLVPKF